MSLKEDTQKDKIVPLLEKKHTHFNALTGEKGFDFFNYEDVMFCLKVAEKDINECPYFNRTQKDRLKEIFKKRFFGEVKK